MNPALVAIPGAPPTVLTRLAGLPAALLTVSGVVGLWLWPPPDPLVWMLIWELTLGVAFALAGHAAVQRRRGTPGVLLLVGGTLLLLAPMASAAGRERASTAVAVLAVAVVLPLGLLRIPARTRAPRLLQALDVAVVLAGTACWVATAVQATAAALIAATTLAVLLFCAGWVHFELSAGEQRRVVLWLTLGFCASVPTGGLFLTAADGSTLNAAAIGVVLAVLSLLLPASAAIALIAPRALDVRVVISQFVLFGVMVALTFTVYGGATAGFELLTGAPPSKAVQGVIVASIAAAFHPLLVRMRATTDELLFGGRADPVDALSRLGTELSAGSSPQEWLGALRIALAVPAIELRSRGEAVARSGPPVPPGSVVTDLRVGEEHVGELVVALPPERLQMPAATQAVMRLVAGPLAQALHATELAEQLRQSRVRVVAVLEEERRRVRRDLHDGLGPTLTGIAYSADAAANLLRSDPAAAAPVLRDLRADAAEAIAEVRRIVYGLRPKALDELGLVGAVRQQVSRLRAADGRALDVDVAAPAELPTLPAAVEVVAYRVAVEAVTNVARHAGVDRARVEFAIDADSFRITVEDGGRSAEAWRPGVGLTTMRERVEQVGGVLSLDVGPDGSAVRASVPLGGP